MKLDPDLGDIFVEIAFATQPDDPAPDWADVSDYVCADPGITITHGRTDEYSKVQPSVCNLTLDNTLGWFTAGYAGSPFYPNVKICRKLRVSFIPRGGGPTYYRHTGYIEEVPTQWPGGGDYSEVAITSIDRFKRLGGEDPFLSVIEQEVLADNPGVYYTLGEPTGSTTAGDTSKNGGAVLATVQVGTGGTLTFGANTGPGTDSLPAPAFAPVGVTNGRYLSGATGSALGQWDTGITLSALALTSAAVQQSAVRVVDDIGDWTELSITAAGKASATNSTGDFTLTSPASVNNGATHRLAMQQSIAGNTVSCFLYVDGVQVASTTYAANFVGPFSVINIGGNAAGALFTGTLSHVAAYTSALSAARIADHAAAALTGFAGERSDQRIARYARWAGIPPAEQNLSVGLSTSMSSAATAGQAPLQAMQDVETTESGVLLMAGDGRLTFQSRTQRYNAANALTLQGEGISPEARFIENATYLVNDATCSRPGGITFRAVDQASKDEFGTKHIDVALLTTSDNEVVDAANWKAHQTSAVDQRLPNLTVDLLTDPAQLGPVLAREVSDRITLEVLPRYAPSQSVGLFVEGWTETISDTGWTWAANCSPAARSSVWALDSILYSQLDVSTRLAY